MANRWVGRRTNIRQIITNLIRGGVFLDLIKFKVLFFYPTDGFPFCVRVSSNTHKTQWKPIDFDIFNLVVPGAHEHIVLLLTRRLLVGH